MSNETKRRSRKWDIPTLLEIPEQHPIMRVFFDPEISKIFENQEERDLTFSELKYILLDKYEGKCPERLKDTSISSIQLLRHYNSYQNIHKDLTRLVELDFLNKDKKGKYILNTVEFEFAKHRDCPIDLKCKKAPICFEKFMDYIKPYMKEIAESKKAREDYLYYFSLSGESD